MHPSSSSWVGCKPFSANASTTSKRPMHHLEFFVGITSSFHPRFASWCFGPYFPSRKQLCGSSALGVVVMQPHHNIMSLGHCNLGKNALLSHCKKKINSSKTMDSQGPKALACSSHRSECRPRFGKSWPRLRASPAMPSHHSRVGKTMVNMKLKSWLLSSCLWNEEAILYTCTLKTATHYALKKDASYGRKGLGCPPLQLQSFCLV